MDQTDVRLRYEAACANPAQPILRREKFLLGSGAYTVTLGPGDVTYLDFAQFFGADLEAVISEIQAASSTATIDFHYDTMGHPDPALNWDIKFDPSELERLMGGMNWPDKLRVHHAIGRLMIDLKMPSWIYVEFHRLLDLKRHFAIGECAEAWVAGTVKDWRLAESYRASPEHILVEHERLTFAVFRKTAFVQSRLEAVALQETQRQEAAAQEAERQRLEEEANHATALAAQLHRSRFTTFVYIMEDTRNGAFKIGHSRTPGKRERTLQSEVPEILLRFAIPAEERHEKDLHAKFSHRRIRGEWFELTAREIIEVITFLRTEGDAERAEADFHWLGVAFLRGN